MTEKIEVVDYYRELSSKYDKKRLSTKKSKLISDLQNNWIINNFESTIATNCLEIGCGTGRLTRNLMRKTRILVATDTSIEMIQINKNELSNKDKKDKIHYVVCDAAHLPFKAKIFSCVVGARVFWHIQNYPQVFEETLKVLNENGLLLFDFPCSWGPFAITSKLFRIKHEVLTLFITGNAIREIFKKSKLVQIRGNASIFLHFMPNRLLKIRKTRKVVYSVEAKNLAFLRNWLYSYYLVKIRK